MLSLETAGIAESSLDNPAGNITDYGGCNSFFRRQRSSLNHSHLFFPIKKTMDDYYVMLFAELLSKLKEDKATDFYFNWQFKVIKLTDKRPSPLHIKILKRVNNFQNKKYTSDFSVLVLDIPPKDTGRGSDFLLYASFIRIFTQLAYEESATEIIVPLSRLSSQLGHPKQVWSTLKRILNIAHSYPVSNIDRTPIIGSAITTSSDSLFYIPYICRPNITFSRFISDYNETPNYRRTFNKLMVGLLLDPSLKEAFQIKVKSATYTDKETLSSFIITNLIPTATRQLLLQPTYSPALIIKSTTTYSLGIKKVTLESAVCNKLKGHIEKGIVQHQIRFKLPPRLDRTVEPFFYTHKVFTEKSKLINYKFETSLTNNVVSIDVRNVNCSKKQRQSYALSLISDFFGISESNSMASLFRTLVGHSCIPYHNFLLNFISTLPTN